LTIAKLYLSGDVDVSTCRFAEIHSAEVYYSVPPLHRTFQTPLGNPPSRAEVDGDADSSAAEPLLASSCALLTVRTPDQAKVAQQTLKGVKLLHGPSPLDISVVPAVPNERFS
jgi:hypothetical protein